jgi:hypothetical protein
MFFVCIDFLKNYGTMMESHGKWGFKQPTMLVYWDFMGDFMALEWEYQWDVMEYGNGISMDSMPLVSSKMAMENPLHYPLVN